MVRIFIRDEDMTSHGNIAAPDALQPLKVPQLFGRHSEIEQLQQAWVQSNTHLCVLTAPAGTGKTALLERWLYELQQQYWLEAEYVYVWSFYPTPHQPGQAVEAFFQHALSWFGARLDEITVDQQAEQLAQYIQQYHTLLILDGLEHCLDSQRPEQLGDARLRQLLQTLAEYNPGLCIVSSQQSLALSYLLQHPACKPLSLTDLSNDAAVQLLRVKGVQGSESKLSQIIAQYGTHALTLRLLAGYLQHWHYGDWRCLEQVPVLLDKNPQGRHARRLLHADAQQLANTGAETVLYFLSLCHQPIDRQSLLQLIKQIPIPWFSRLKALLGWHQHEQLADLLVPLKKLNHSGQQQTFITLQELGLLKKTGHFWYLAPTVRSFFQEQLRQDWPMAWQAARQHVTEFENQQQPLTIPTPNKVPPISPTRQVLHPTNIMPTPTPTPILNTEPMPALTLAETVLLPAETHEPDNAVAITHPLLAPHKTPKAAAKQLNDVIPHLESLQRSLQQLQQHTHKFQRSVQELDRAVQSSACSSA